MATSVLAQIRTIEQQKAKVKAETLRKVKKALKELNRLGFDYQVFSNGHTDSLADRTGRGRVARKSPSRKARKLKDEPCKICGFRTVKAHDARSHRGQANKAPFTKKELAERGLRRA
jgi:hypothetical protein